MFFISVNTNTQQLLLFLVIRSLFLIPLDISIFSVQFLSSTDALAFSSFIEPFLMGACILLVVCHPHYNIRLDCTLQNVTGSLALLQLSLLSRLSLYLPWFHAALDHDSWSPGPYVHMQFPRFLIYVQFCSEVPQLWSAPLVGSGWSPCNHMVMISYHQSVITGQKHCMIDGLTSFLVLSPCWRRYLCPRWRILSDTAHSLWTFLWDSCWSLSSSQLVHGFQNCWIWWTDLKESYLPLPSWQSRKADLFLISHPIGGPD